MPRYEYRCPDHRDVRDNIMCLADDRPDTLRCYCDFCQDWRDFKRVYGFNHKPGMEEHFNHTVHQPISSMRQFTDALHRAEEAAAQPTIAYTADGEKVSLPGRESRYRALEWGDHAAFGATNEGIYESNVERSRIGAPLLPDIG